MPDGPAAGDVAYACMSVLVDELVRLGLTDACVSPGSRSTPIALALARHGGVRVHVILDERSSGFSALGMAKAGGRPVALVCTSGTAVANLFPAVVEASMAHAPLLLLTADRPPELRGVGANQTIDQVGMFGSYPRWAVDVEVPAARDDEARRWRTLGRRAWEAAVAFPAGPVHLNLPFREPLVPTGAPVDLGSDDAERPAGSTLGPRVDPPRIPADALDAVARLATAHPRGLILAGGSASPGEPVLAGGADAFANATGWPVIAELRAGSRGPSPGTLVAGHHLLADAAFAGANAPDVVVQLGSPPTNRAGQAVVARAPELVVVARQPGRSDPSLRSAVHVDAEPGRFVHAVAERLTPRGRTAWIRAWAEADAAARRAVDAVLDAHDEPFEGRVARDLFATLPEGAVLFAGSSMPIRDLDSYATLAPGREALVIANRGASGIDGSVSTTLGIAAAMGRTTFALIGDLALLHDAGALLWSAGGGHDVVLVVPNNGGGGIFDLLPVAGEPEHERLFVTPHRVDLAAVASAACAGYVRVERAGDLAGAVLAAAEEGGVHVIDVTIDRALAVRIREEVRRAVRGALSELGYA